MDRRFQLRLLRWAFLLAYAFALVMSAAHLASWYGLTAAGLPPFMAVGLAASLEVAAFLLSIASSAYGSQLPTARYGAYGALTLVWVGNFLAMVRSGVGVPLWEVFLQSLFVPVSTMVVGKVIGDLLRLEEALREEGSQGEGDPYAVVLASPAPTEDHTSLVLPLLKAMPHGITLEDLSLYLPIPKERVESTLSSMQAMGLARKEGDRWYPAPSQGKGRGHLA